jgi:RNA polymerase sigma factor (sigma-70 family)
MRDGSRGEVLRRVHTLFDVGTVAGLTDGELLGRFAAREGEAAELAFAALVDRHGPMVLRVCHRVLRDPHDAQDAFQATFLVLVRKAGSVRSRDSVGSWLYGVASRVSADARAAAARRRRFDRSYAETSVIARDEASAHDRGELGAVLHEELGRLPERYRAPIVLCCLEGLSHEQAALRLGRPVATVRTWLARGRERLRGRLARRGLAPSAGAVSAALAADARAEVPPALTDSTVKAAARVAAGRSLAAGAVPASVAALTQGMLRTMLMTKLKIAASVLTALGAVATGAGVFAFQAPAPKGAPAPFFRESERKNEFDRDGAGGRAEAAERYLERTNQEIDAAISELAAEIAELTARLDKAKASLRRMQALKAALTDSVSDANRFNVPLGERKGVDRRNAASNRLLEANRAQQPGQNQSGQKGQDPGTAQQGGQPPQSESVRLHMLEAEIDRLVKERDRLRGQGEPRPQTK